MSTIHARPHLRRRRQTCLAATVLAAGAAFTPGHATAAPSAASAAATTSYVVVYRDGVDARAKANKANIKTSFVYSHALSGFAADLTSAQREQLAADPQVLMVTAADRTQVPLGDAPQKKTPIKNFPQQPQPGVSRIGTLASPTAHVDGKDDRVQVDVAVIDGRVDNMADLNVAGGTNCTGGAPPPADPHGTMVAGVVGAEDNRYGVVGVAPGARIWSVPIFQGDYANDANLLCGLDWVSAHSDDVEVVNMSLSDTGADDGNCGLTNHDPVHWGVCHVVNQGGVTAVAAAGNDSTDTSSRVPAVYSEVIAVSSMADTDGKPGGLGSPTCEGDADDSFSFFSNYGAAVDLAGPGECVVSTFPGGNLGIDSGTSYAAPHVAGAAALYLATHPAATPAQVRAALIAHRENTALPGDPDGINEGIVNVAGW